MFEVIFSVQTVFPNIRYTYSVYRKPCLFLISHFLCLKLELSKEDNVCTFESSWCLLECPKGIGFKRCAVVHSEKFLTNVAGDNVMTDNMKYFLKTDQGDPCSTV